MASSKLLQTIFISKALLVDPAGNLLVLRRSDSHPTQAGARDLPGGQVDEGEDLGETLVREIQEEAGLTVALADLYPVYAGTEVHNDICRVRVFYIVRLKNETPTVQISWEHSKAEWLTAKELADIENEFNSFYCDALKHVRTYNLL